MREDTALGYLADIRFFGDVAAEQDATILSYFLKTPAVDEIDSGLKHLVLGRKGSGKSALVKYFSTSKPTHISTALNLKSYPWNIHAQRVNVGASTIESYVASWRYLIAVQANAKLLEHAGFKVIRDSQKAAYTFLEENYGGARPKLEEIIRPKVLKLSRGSFKPAYLGVSLGQIEFDTVGGGVSPTIDLLTDALIQNALTMASQQGVRRVSLHFDELDQGMNALDEGRERMLIGLVIASRSFFSSESTKGRICPTVYLRTDLWDAMSFSDKNKISQSSTVHLEWNSETLRQLVDRRISAKIGEHHGWDDIEDTKLMRGSQSKWNHIVARTFLRPRDVISFLNIVAELAIRQMPDADIIENADIIAAREPYSRYIKQELDDEVKPHWPNWFEALQSISELATVTLTRADFARSWERRKGAKKLSVDDALERLYQYSIIGYRRGIGRGGSGWVFQYSDPDAGWDNAASRLKVHQGLKEFAKLREAREGA